MGDKQLTIGELLAQGDEVQVTKQAQAKLVEFNKSVASFRDRINRVMDRYTESTRKELRQQETTDKLIDIAANSLQYTQTQINRLSGLTPEEIADDLIRSHEVRERERIIDDYMDPANF